MVGVMPHRGRIGRAFQENKEVLLFLKKKKQKDFYFWGVMPTVPVTQYM
jgi:hypothetical protein